MKQHKQRSTLLSSVQSFDNKIISMKMQEVTDSCQVLEWQMDAFQKYITRKNVSEGLLFDMPWLSNRVHARKKTVHVYCTHEPLQQLN